MAGYWGGGGGGGGGSSTIQAAWLAYYTSLFFSLLAIHLSCNKNFSACVRIPGVVCG